MVQQMLSAKWLSNTWRTTWLVVAMSMANVHPALGQIEVSLADGTLVRVDQVGRETDERNFAIKVENSRIVLTRLLPWEKVVSAKFGDRTYSRQELFSIFNRVNSMPATAVRPQSVWNDATAAAIAPTVQGRVIEPTNGLVVGIHDDPLNAYANEIKRFFPSGVPVLEAGFVRDFMRNYKFHQMAYGPQPLSPLLAPGVPLVPLPAPGVPVPLRAPVTQSKPIQAIEARARPISSRGKVDWDALALEVVAFDEDGRIVPVDGTLQATLWGSRQRLVRRHTIDPYLSFLYPSRRQTSVDILPGRITKIASWSKPVFSDTKELVLRFGRRQPDHDIRLAPYGDLHVKLIVPGEGVFETTQTNVALRKDSLLREQYFAQSGSRFFPSEGTSGR